MTKRSCCALVLALCGGALGCSDAGPAGTTPATGGTGISNGFAGMPAAVGGAGSTSVATGGRGGAIAAAGVGSSIAGIGAASGTGGKAGGGGTGATAGTASAAGMGGRGGAGGSAGAVVAGSGGSSGGSGGAGGTGGGNGTSLTGTLGALGAVQPVMNGWATTNGPETLIYLTTAKLACADMMTMGVKWLSKLPAGSQVIELVVPGAAMVKTYPIGLLQGEVNYAEGSKSSSSEVTGKTGSIMFTKAEAKGVHEGTITVTAPYTLMGSFHAEWCQGGAEF
jgi:hypothetical protein